MLYIHDTNNNNNNNNNRIQIDQKMNDKIEQLRVKKFIKGNTFNEKLQQFRLPEKLKIITIEKLLHNHVIYYFYYFYIIIINIIIYLETRISSSTKEKSGTGFRTAIRLKQ